MERIAQEGVTFETCWSSAMCFPSRALLMTGKYPYQTKIYHNHFRPYPNEPHYFPHERHVTLPFLFKQAGYKTYVSGKWHMPGNIPNKHTTEVGFDEYCVHVHNYEQIPKDQEFDGFVEKEPDLWPGRVSVFWHPGLMFNGQMIDTTIDDYGPDIFNDYAIKFVDQHQDSDQPFFLYYPLYLAHTQPDYMTGAPEQFVPVPERDENGKWTGKRTPPGQKYEIEYADYLIGRLYDHLEQNGMLENTIFLVTGDNSSVTTGRKCEPVADGCLVPFFITGPGIEENVRSRALIEFTDIYSTLADAVGIDAPDSYKIDGKSFWPVLSGAKEKTRDHILVHFGYDKLVRDEARYLDGYDDLYFCGESRHPSEYQKATPEMEGAAAARKRLQAVRDSIPEHDAVEDAHLMERYKREWSAFLERAAEQQRKRNES